MRGLASTFLCVVLAACGSHGSATTSDAPGGGDGGGDGGMINDAGGGDDGGGATGRDITVTLIDHPNDAASFAFLAAYQDGSAPWQLASTPVGDTYEFTVHAPVWSFAYTCTEPAAAGGGTGTAEETRIVALAQFAVAERTSLTLTIPEACTDRIQRVALTGTVSNPAPGGATLVQFGAARAGVVSPSTDAYRIETAPGTHDLIALHGTGGGAVGGGGGLAADAIALARGVTVTGPTMHDLDFATAEPPQLFPVSVMTSNTASVTASTVLYTAGATSAGLVTSSSEPYTTASLAADQMAAGDRYAQVVTISSGGQTAILTNVTDAPAAQTVGEPTALGGATSTVPTTTPYPEIATTWTSYGSAVGYMWTASQQLQAAQCGANAQAPCRIVWATLLSPGVLGAMPHYQMPDLAGLAGWSPTYQLVPGVNATGYVEAETSSAGAGDFPPASPPPAGTERVEVRAAYAATP